MNIGRMYTPVYSPCGESLTSLHPPRVHGIHSRLVYNPHKECLKGLNPPKFHRINSRLVYNLCDDTL